MHFCCFAILFSTPYHLFVGNPLRLYQQQIGKNRSSLRAKSIKQNPFKLGFLACRGIYSNYLSKSSHQKSIKNNYLCFLIFFKWEYRIHYIFWFMQGAVKWRNKHWLCFWPQPSVKSCILQSFPNPCQWDSLVGPGPWRHMVLGSNLNFSTY